MVQITQTEEEVKIVIELNRLITRKPDIVLLSQYIKFNNPPIFFERHLTGEIDELASFCRILKNEARLVLIKKQKGIWPELFQNLTKEQLMQKRLEIADLIVERNKERDQKAIERYELKRRHEIEKEVRREAAIRERVKQFEENACREALVIGNKETHSKQKTDTRPHTAVGRASRVPASPASPKLPPPRSLAAVRNAGKISVCFSNFAHVTPKRESTANIKMPFTISSANNNEEEQNESNAGSSLNDPE